jgi:multidrug efflux pump subunit AcrB
MKYSNFTILLTMVVLMIIGAAVMPMLKVGTEPMERQGKTLTIQLDWPGVAAKVVEQNVTSPIEGIVTSVKGIERVSSDSYFGRSEIHVQLKPETDVSSIRFEISSLLRQIYSRLPKGVGYPSLSGGEVVTGASSHNENRLLLSYMIHADMQSDMIKSYVDQQIARPLQQVSGVSKVGVSGTNGRYIEISYDPVRLAACGLTGNNIAEAIQNFIGRDEIIGEIWQQTASGTMESVALRLATAEFSKSLEQMPIANRDGKIFYLNDLATYHYKNYEPWSYYRVNGMNTIYLNVYVPGDADVILLSDDVQEEMEAIRAKIGKDVYVEMFHDEAEGQREEVFKLVSRTLMSLFLLLLFVWMTSRDLRYLLIIAVALAANLLISAIAYWMFGIQLHIYSLAGITVSLGLIIDSTIVMADHYSYYRNRKTFLAIFAALLTTIGSLIVIFFLPKELQDNLYDFAWIIIINLTVSLLVAFFFVPSLVDQLHYNSCKKSLRRGRGIARWNRFYESYLRLTNHHRWIYYTLLILAFGIPFHALPTQLGQDDFFYDEQSRRELKWYEELYNETLGSDFFQNTLKEPLSKVTGGSMRLFAQSLNEGHSSEEQQDKVLIIRAQMPLGGTSTQLNEKMKILEEFLKTFKEIKLFTTQINGGSGMMEVQFGKEYAQTGFPYLLENKVIGKVITIGGADWSTYGVSQRGFSNALNLQYRSNKIIVSGFNYDRLYRLAEDIADYMKGNNRVQDLLIETPGREAEEDELYMRYAHDRFSLYGTSAGNVHGTLSGMLSENHVGQYHDRYVSSEIILKPTTYDSFDLWNLNNAAVQVGDASMTMPDFMKIEWRTAKNSIHRENQEYVLHIAFNILGSYTYTDRYIRSVIEHFTKTLPVGYKCKSPTYSTSEEESTKYWLVALVIVIIFFICTILFESFRSTMVVISIIPVTLIGTFLTFYFSGAEFGAGGFASLVLLCGITVNSGIYILNQYNILQRSTASGIGAVGLYVKAYNHKIIPVFLTVASTITGLIPFFFDGKEEPFWCSFATGVTGGLVLSILAIIFIMPLFVRFKRK